MSEHVDPNRMLVVIVDNDEDMESITTMIDDAVRDDMFAGEVTLAFTEEGATVEACAEGLH